MKINRKTAEEVIIKWIKEGTFCFALATQDSGQDSDGFCYSKEDIAQDKKEINKFLAQFPDEPTPDEMLDEMREWASVKNYGIDISITNEESYVQITDMNEDCETDEPIIFANVWNNQIKEAIVEAYRQWQQLTQKEIV